MKVEASLLRPVIDIAGDLDFCARPKLGATAAVPELRVRVSAMPVTLRTKVTIFGISLFSASTEGTLGGFQGTVSTPPDRPITLNLDGCVQAVARLNPRNLQLPKCCEGFKEPVPCCCEVHKQHMHCGSECNCKQTG